jgi:uncharacterized membrane protein
MFLTAVIVICIVIWVATWIGAIIDMSRRKDLKLWQIVAWVAAIVVFPIIGLIAYILFRPAAGSIEYKGEEIS